jgi:hypothetical protein
MSGMGAAHWIEVARRWWPAPGGAFAAGMVPAGRGSSRNGRVVGSRGWWARSAAGTVITAVAARAGGIAKAEAAGADGKLERRELGGKVAGSRDGRIFW